MKVGRHSNVVSLVGTCSFEGNLRQARAVQTTNKCGSGKSTYQFD